MRLPIHATISPGPEKGTCEERSCNEKELLTNVDPDGKAKARTLCPRHRVEYLQEVYFR